MTGGPTLEAGRAQTRDDKQTEEGSVKDELVYPRENTLGDSEMSDAELIALSEHKALET